MSCALAASCLHLAEAAIHQKRVAEAVELADAAYGHTKDALEQYPDASLAYVWHGMAMQTSGKLEGEIEQVGTRR